MISLSTFITNEPHFVFLRSKLPAFTYFSSHLLQNFAFLLQSSHNFLSVDIAFIPLFYSLFQVSSTALRTPLFVDRLLFFPHYWLFQFMFRTHVLVFSYLSSVQIMLLLVVSADDLFCAVFIITSPFTQQKIFWPFQYFFSTQCISSILHPSSPKPSYALNSFARYLVPGILNLKFCCTTHPLDGFLPSAILQVFLPFLPFPPAHSPAPYFGWARCQKNP